ncbi:rust resistance kinase Lr10-like [Forsythia ovata]|uniref:non-specific serine/threonine protein kinase n=1 Tax=Forsythia ovata TaxID=205694 RepID=A0ABD1X2J6_9LAMI
MRLLFAFSIIFIILSHCAKYCKAKENHYSCPHTFCGSISNISYPFRLRGDPENCGNRSYELACENNRTILYLSSNKYYVQSISYNNFTIRVLDPGLEKTSCASYPINTPLFDDILLLYNLRAVGYYDLTFGHYDLNTPIIYTRCEAPAKSPFYVDTSFCSKNISLQKYSYVVVGNNVTVADFEDSCRVDTSAWISKDFPIVDNATFSEIQDGLAYGFVLTWYRVYCGECEAPKGYCYYNGSGTVGCNYSHDMCRIFYPSTLRPTHEYYGRMLEKILEKILGKR